MNKIQSISTFFKYVLQLLFVSLPILLILFWINAPDPVSSIAAQYGFPLTFIPEGINILHPLATTTRFLGFLVCLIPLSINLFIVYFLIRLFSRFQQADIFSLQNVKCFKRIGITILVGQVLNFIYQALITGLLTYQNPPGHRVIMISFQSTNIGLVITALLIILISWIFAEGHKLIEEQRYTI